VDRRDRARGEAASRGARRRARDRAWGLDGDPLPLRRLRPTVIYDWDSLNTDFETVFVGGAAATFTYTERLPVEVWPSVAEAHAFFEEYEDARGTPFTPAEAAAARGAAVYTRAYSTRCTHAVGKDTAGLALRQYAESFLGRE
jgi:hypothetical protein